MLISLLQHINTQPVDPGSADKFAQERQKVPLYILSRRLVKISFTFKKETLVRLPKRRPSISVLIAQACGTSSGESAHMYRFTRAFVACIHKERMYNLDEGSDTKEVTASHVSQHVRL